MCLLLLRVYTAFPLSTIRGEVQTGPLVSAELHEKLALSKDQKEKIERIEKEYAEKNKDAEAKMKEAREKARQDKDRAALQQALQAAQKMRGGYEDKVKAVLNDEQKKKFDDGKQPGRRPGAPPGVRPADRTGDGKLDLTSKDVQEQLALTAEQKEKLETLRKEYEAKSAGVLSKEQKEKFEELKKQAAQPRVRRPNPEQQ